MLFLNQLLYTSIMNANSIDALNTLLRIGLSLFVIIMLWFSIKCINILFKKHLKKFIDRMEYRILKPLFSEKNELIRTIYFIRFFNFIANIIRYIIITCLLYGGLLILFNIFPKTKAISNQLLEWTLIPLYKMYHMGIGYFPKLIVIIIVVLIILYTLRCIQYFAREIENKRLNFKGFYPEWAKPTYQIIRFFLIVFGFILVFPYLPGSSTPIFKGVSVFLGVLFSLGSTSVIGNIVSGIVVTYMRPFQIGDRIKINQIEGIVLEKTIFVIRVQTFMHEVVTIPNANVLSSSIVNYSTSTKTNGLIVYTSVTIGYNTPWRTIHELLINAALKTDLILKDPTPFVLQTALNDFFVTYQICAYTKDATFLPAIYSDLHKNIQDEFNQANIEILSPHYFNLRDGNQISIPPNYMPPTYQASSFNISVKK
ncbi:MAG: mechanosensitive ion channel family protein [Chitinophagaceae bacterium]